MRKLVIISVVSLIFSASCQGWNVDTIRSKNFLTILPGEEPGQVTLPVDSQGITNLSLSLTLAQDRLIVIDNSQKRVQILSLDGKPQLVLGAVEAITDKSIKKAAFNFSVIGRAAMNSKGFLYVQNRVQPQNPAANMGDDVVSDFSPSYVLAFNPKGELAHTIGRNGTPDIPFYYIEKLFIDSQDRLFVVSRSFNTWAVYRYTGTALDFSVNLGKIEFRDKQGNDSFDGRIETVSVLGSGDRFLVSVAFYHDLRFKYRKIYEYSLSENKITKTLIELQDPKHVFFNLADDRLIYFWDMVDSTPRFMITDFSGKRVNTFKMAQQGGRVHYSSVLTDRKGKIYSFNITSSNIKFYSWE